MKAAPVRCICGGLVIDRRCNRCGRGRYLDQRPNSTRRGYGYKWQQFRAWLLKQNGYQLCADCLDEDIVTRAQELHHKQKVADRPDLQYEPTNIVPLCTPHHSKRTRAGE